MRATRGLTAHQTEQTLVYVVGGGDGIGLEVHSTTLDPHHASGIGKDVSTGPVLPARPQIHSLRVFVDKSVVESHLDARVSASTWAFPTSSDATHLYLFNSGATSVVVESVEVWGMRSIWW